jgi:hypothetical protein
LVNGRFEKRKDKGGEKELADTWIGICQLLWRCWFTPIRMSV